MRNPPPEKALEKTWVVTWEKHHSYLPKVNDMFRESNMKSFLFICPFTSIAHFHE